MVSFLLRASSYPGTRAAALSVAALRMSAAQSARSAAVQLCAASQLSSLAAPCSDRHCLSVGSAELHSRTSNLFGALRVQQPLQSPLRVRPEFSLTVCEQAVTELPPRLQNIVKGFQAVPDPRARYQQLLHYAAKLSPLPKEYHTTENKVVGCVSQVWVVPTLKSDGTVYFQADSDSALTKGLAALLVEGLSGSPPADILRVTPDFVQMLGLKQSLTPSRNNGFLNMLKLMQKKTLELYIQSEAAQAGSSGSGEGRAEQLTASGDYATSSSGDGGSSNGEGGPSKKTLDRPIYSGIKNKLEKELGAEVDIQDVSHQHAGHAGVHKGATETHFNVKVVSQSFEGLNTVKRHRLVYNLLSEEFGKGLHALSLVTKTPAEVRQA